MTQPGPVERQPFVHLAGNVAGSEDILEQPAPGVHVPDYHRNVSGPKARADEVGHLCRRQFGLVPLAGGQQEPDALHLRPTKEGVLGVAHRP